MKLPVYFYDSQDRPKGLSDEVEVLAAALIATPMLAIGQVAEIRAIVTHRREDHLAFLDFVPVTAHPGLAIFEWYLMPKRQSIPVRVYRADKHSEGRWHTPALWDCEAMMPLLRTLHKMRQQLSNRPYFTCHVNVQLEHFGNDTPEPSTN